MSRAKSEVTWRSDTRVLVIHGLTRVLVIHGLTGWTKAGVTPITIYKVLKGACRLTDGPYTSGLCWEGFQYYLLCTTDSMSLMAWSH